MIKVIYSDGTEQDITVLHTRGKQGNFSLVDRRKKIESVVFCKENPSIQQKRWRSEHREQYNEYTNMYRKRKALREMRVDNGNV